MSFQEKYFKYKNKYLTLRKQLGGDNFNIGEEVLLYDKSWNIIKGIIQNKTKENEMTHYFILSDGNIIEKPDGVIYKFIQPKFKIGDKIEYMGKNGIIKDIKYGMFRHKYSILYDDGSSTEGLDTYINLISSAEPSRQVSSLSAVEPSRQVSSLSAAEPSRQVSSLSAVEPSRPKEQTGMYSFTNSDYKLVQVPMFRQEKIDGETRTVEGRGYKLKGPPTPNELANNKFKKGDRIYVIDYKGIKRKGTISFKKENIVDGIVYYRQNFYSIQFDDKDFTDTGAYEYDIEFL